MDAGGASGREVRVENRLLTQAVAALTAQGCRVSVAGSVGEALAFVARVAAGKRLAVLSRGEAGEEIGVAGFLAGQGLSVWRCGETPGKTVQACLEADLGVTGAQAVAVETGTIFLAEEGGEARLVSNLPPTHLVVAGAECLAPDLAGALAMVRRLSRDVYGRPLVRYVSAISGPSRTGDIGMQLVPGMHGPREVAVLLLARTCRTG